MTKTPIRALIIGVAALFFLTGAANACGHGQVKGADAAIPPERNVNAALIDAAILAEVNNRRCKAGLETLAGAAGLRKVAATHAKWMARAQQLSHKSQVPGQKSAMARLKASGLKIRRGAENIGLVSRYQFDGTRFRITNAASCQFAGASGKAIAPHSYASLARYIVSLWMQSPDHRRNILDRRMKRLGSGVGYDPRASNCGKFYVSQSFVG